MFSNNMGGQGVGVSQWGREIGLWGYGALQWLFGLEGKGVVYDDSR